MLIKAALFSINKSIASVLSRDLNTEKALLACGPFSAVIYVNDLNLLLKMSVTSSGLVLEKILQQVSCDLSIVGSGASLSFAMIRALKFKEWHLQELYLEGDVEKFKRIFECLQQLDLDIDGLLARYAGDGVAHLARKSFNAANAWQASVKSSLIASSLDYLQAELKWLPSKVELQDFYDEVDTLNLRSERLQALFQQVYAKLKDKAS